MARGLTGVRAITYIENNPVGPVASTSTPALDGGSGRTCRPWLRRHMASQRLRPLLVLAVGVVGIFTVQRLILTCLYHRELATVPAKSILRVFLVGLGYDLQVTSYLAALLIPLLALTPNAAFRRRWFRWVLAGYVVTALTLVFALVIIDACFFAYYDANRLNYLVTDYMACFGEIAQTIWLTYPVVWLGVLLLVLVAGTLWCVRRFCFAGPFPHRRLASRLAYAAVLSAMAGLAARGTGADGWVPDNATAYFSSNNVVCQLSLNPTVTLVTAIAQYYSESDTDSVPIDLPPMDPDEAFARVRRALTDDRAVFGGHPGNPLWRTVQTGRPRRRPNIVFIVMESFADGNIGAMGCPRDASRTPFFDKIAGEGLFFSRMYAAGHRTSRGLAGVVCGFPDIGGKSILQRPRTQGTHRAFLSIAGLLGERGYQSIFVYGGRASFDNMGRFFRCNGFDRVIDQQQMPDELPLGTWGACDHVVLDRAHEAFTAMAGEGEPFFALVLTSSNHSPYEYPAGLIDPLPGDDDATVRANAIRYADWSMERFFARARRGDTYFKDTLFVLVADHGQRPFDATSLVDVDGYRVPCLFYAPGMPDLLQRGRIDITCSQTDVSPTLLGLLGGTYAHGMFGRDMVHVARTHPDEPGFALLQQYGRLALLRGPMAVVWGGNRWLYYRQGDGGDLQPLSGAYAAEAAGMEDLAGAMWHSATNLCWSVAYNRPGRRVVRPPRRVAAARH